MTRPFYTPSQLGSIVERGRKGGWACVRVEQRADAVVIEFSDKPAQDDEPQCLSEQMERLGLR